MVEWSNTPRKNAGRRKPNTKMYFVYIIQSLKNKKRYIAYTSNIEKRLEYHNKGLNRSTKPYRPYELIYLENQLTKKGALSREKVLKSYKGGKALTLLLTS